MSSNLLFWIIHVVTQMKIILSQFSNKTVCFQIKNVLPVRSIKIPSRPGFMKSWGSLLGPAPLSCYLLVSGIMRSLTTWLLVGIKSLKLSPLWFYGARLLDFTGPCWNDLSTSTPHGPTPARPLDQTLLLWVQTASGKLRCGRLHRESQMLSSPNFTLKHLMHFKKGFSLRLKQADGSSNTSKDCRIAVFPLSHNPFCFSSFSTMCLSTVLWRKRQSVPNPDSKNSAEQEQVH